MVKIATWGFSHLMIMTKEINFLAFEVCLQKLNKHFENLKNLPQMYQNLSFTDTKIAFIIPNFPITNESK